jgi:hypothetical protein
MALPRLQLPWDSSPRSLLLPYADGSSLAQDGNHTRDWDMLALDVSDEALHDRILRAVKTTATREPRIGRKLPHMCKAAGLSEITVKIFANPDLNGWAIPMLEHICTSMLRCLAR